MKRAEIQVEMTHFKKAPVRKKKNIATRNNRSETCDQVTSGADRIVVIVSVEILQSTVEEQENDTMAGVLFADCVGRFVNAVETVFLFFSFFFCRVTRIQ